MEESHALLNARIRAVEHQRDVALAQWAIERANLEIARAAIAEQDALIARLRARLDESN